MRERGRIDSVFTKPVAGPNDPDAVPTRVMTRTVLATNVGSSAAEMDSTVMTDPNVTHLRVHPKGAFAGRNGAELPSFQLKYRLQIRQPE